MAKFYVQSGTLKAIVDSQDAERAAMWAVQRAMDQILLDEPEFGEAAESQVVGCNAERQCVAGKQAAFVALGPSILISEQGFQANDAIAFDTFEIFCDWHELARAVDRLSRMFE